MLGFTTIVSFHSPLIPPSHSPPSHSSPQVPAERSNHRCPYTTLDPPPDSHTVHNIVSYHFSPAQTYALTQRQILCNAGGAHFGILIGAWHRLVNSFPSIPQIFLASVCSNPRLKADRKNCRFVYCSCAMLYAMYLCTWTMSVLPL
jgi:hypothetical protein